MNILRKNSQNHLLIKLLVVCIILVFFLVNTLNSQGQNKSTAEANANSQSQNPTKDSQEHETKLNDQIGELKKQIAELTQKVSDNKQAFYDSIFNLWSLLLTLIGIILVIITIKGAKNLSEKITELKTDNTTAIDKSEKNIAEIKTDLNQRITELNEKIKEFKIDQKENFAKFEKESNEKINRGLSFDLQKAIEKIMDESFAGQLNDISEQLSELRNKVENLSNYQNTVEISTANPEVNQFDDTLDKQKSKGENAFDE